MTTHDPLQSLTQLARRQRFPPGALVFRPHDPAESVFLLLRGRVRIALPSRDGKELTLALLISGDLFGEQALAGAPTRGSLAETLAESTLGEIALDPFERALAAEPFLARRVLRLLGARQRQTERRFEELAFRDVPTRLARTLLRFARRHGRETEEGTTIAFPLTHRELASWIGATRETTTAALGNLQRAGLVKLARQRIVIVDREGLSIRAGAARRVASTHPPAGHAPGPIPFWPRIHRA